MITWCARGSIEKSNGFQRMCMEKLFFSHRKIAVEEVCCSVVLPFVTTTECSGGNLRFLPKRNYMKIKLVLLAISKNFFYQAFKWQIV